MNKKLIADNKLGINESLIVAHGITLITLVVTIVLLLILAGIVINLGLGQNGIFNRAKQATKQYGEIAAKEKLEAVLMEAVVEKETNKDYNNTNFLDEMLENNKMDVNGNNVIVDNYNFEIDREKLKVTKSLGESQIKITSEVQKYLGKNEKGKYEAEISLVIESNSGLKSITIKNPDGTQFEIQTERENIAKGMIVEFDEEYTITVTDKAGKTESRKIVERLEEAIRTAEELAEFRDKVNSGLTYEGKTLNVINDLDLRSVCNEENPWKSIGEFNEHIEGTYNVFSGTFNGNKHTIDYLYIDTDSELSQGLFGYTLNATITGVVIGEHTSINAVRLVGGVVGYATNSKILYCGNNGNIKAKKDSIGGIVGALDSGEIVGCYNKGEIIGIDNVSGICGDVSIYEGENKNNTIKYSYNTGVIKGKGNISGICGYSEGYGYIEKCYNKGAISFVNEVSNNYGGIVGRALSRRYIDKQQTIEEEAKTQISYTCNIGTVNSTGRLIGGIIGRNEQYCTVKDSYILKGLEIRKGSDNASSDIGVNNDYLGKIVGSQIKII